MTENNADENDHPPVAIASGREQGPSRQVPSIKALARHLTELRKRNREAKAETGQS